MVGDHAPEEHTPVPSTTGVNNPIELEAQKDAYNFQFAMRNLELTAQDNREQRAHFAGNRRAGMAVILAVVIAVFIFFMYALHLGKDVFLTEMMKVVVSAFGGGGIGYAIGIKKRNQ